MLSFYQPAKLMSPSQQHVQMFQQVGFGSQRDREHGIFVLEQTVLFTVNYEGNYDSMYLHCAMDDFDSRRISPMET